MTAKRPDVRDLFPFGVYDTKKCGLAYIGLHVGEDDVWQIFLGWPSANEIAHAKSNGLKVVPLTVTHSGGIKDAINATRTADGTYKL